MPTPEDLDRLRALAAAREEGTPFEGDEAPTLARETNPGSHVSVHLHQHDKKEAAHGIHKLVESGWAKAVMVLVLGAGAGAGGSETHRVVAAAGLVTKAELEEHKKEIARELGKQDQKLAGIEALREEIVTVRGVATMSRLESRALGIYLYGVLPRLGVQVTLAEGGEPPPRMEFHPPPLSLAVGPNAAKPIQPAVVFPLPPAP